ncbi:SusC/RagA family TonB-linked outer membrane protein [Flavivirga rizhaonensis]|nr:SusC/RagA family TonB-linked outer membrane protein [Flavivirga rizhaonensis]
MIKTKTLYLVLITIFFMKPFAGIAQEVNELNEVSATITNKSGDGLKDVLIQASNSKNTTLTNENGVFRLKIQEEDILIISRLGYEESVIYIDNGSLENETIVLKQFGVIQPEEAINISLGNLPFERITGSVERITGDELSDFPTAFVQEALAGRLSGLTSNYNDALPTAEGFGNSIRRQGAGQILVDGVPVTNIVLTPAEVDDVVIAKDYGSSFMFGTLGAPGAIIVNSKHGLPGGRSIKFKSRTGVRTPTFLPNVMNAQDYAKNYNTALVNDGFAPIYSQNDINDYTTGENPVRNPNNNYYDDLVDGVSTYSHVTGDFSGGNKNVQYFSHLGFYNTNGIESVGDGRKLTRLRLNNNVQIKFSEKGAVNLGIGGSFNKRKEPALNANSAFNTMYNYPANALPYKINDTIYGRTPEYGTNLLVGLAHGSIIEDERRDAFARIGLDLDLSELTKGLTFKALVGMYTLNILSKRRDPRVNMAEPVFTLNNDGSYTTTFRNYTRGNNENDWVRAGDRVDRSQFINANLHYNRDFSDDHKVIADVIFSNQEITGSQLVQNTIFRNLGLRVNYLLKQKYVLEGKLMNSPIRQLSQDERSKINYDAGFAWLMHKENFFAGTSWLNFLKLRANFGVQSRPVSQFFISENLYGGLGSGQFGINGKTSSGGGNIRVFTASGDIRTPKQEYLSIGVDFQMANSKINGQLNYFNIRNYDQIGFFNGFYAILPSNFSPLVNKGDTRFRGIDGSISYNNKIGNLSYKFGVNAMYGESYATEFDYINYPAGEEQRNITGNKGGRILGLEADGIFQNDTEVANAIPQLFGEVKPGDIRYKDFNNDGVIDEKDIHEIGNAPRFSYGVNYMMQYKNWSFSVHGDGVLGGDYVETLHWNRGTNNYTKEIANSWPVSNSLPKLTTLSNSNNYRNSSFWLKNAGYFNVRSIMVAYSLPQAFLKNIGVKDFSFSAASKNPFVISSNKDRYMPSRNKGYLEHPVLKAFELGIQVTF